MKIRTRKPPPWKQRRITEGEIAEKMRRALNPPEDDTDYNYTQVMRTPFGFSGRVAVDMANEIHTYNPKASPLQEILKRRGWK